jgi:hypothetical protein
LRIFAVPVNDWVVTRLVGPSLLVTDGSPDAQAVMISEAGRMATALFKTFMRGSSGVEGRRAP